ncbi:class E sortase [Arthrobacter sp. QXT-31]|uniref:class E sortase n=1 Tax=Arthrobacter sp. QXT-31 TaxID=1357915 RepID=UPI0009719DD2|nr:class E sortase [Arthrobacter sp. QXT-31]APX00522.1 class E sortase [Arthrobacter sp. QXT-31]
MILRRAVQIFGELLITAGIVALLFVAWQLWWTNVESNATQSEAVRDFAREMGGQASPAPGSGAADPVTGTTDHGTPVVSEAPGHGGTIGIMYIPRFGENFARPIVEGTTTDLLDTLGLGHYSETSMPGAVGNFAVAGHRQTHGAVLDNVHALVPGDRIYVQTRDGYYVYVYRNNRIVLPSSVDVLLPVPSQPGVRPTERILSLITCNPRFGSEERFVAYSVLDHWQPASAGPPPEIAAQVTRASGEG